MESKATKPNSKLLSKASRGIAEESDRKHKDDSPVNTSSQYFDDNYSLPADTKAVSDLIADDKSSHRGDTVMGYKSASGGTSRGELVSLADARERRPSRDAKETDAIVDDDEGDAEFLAMMRKPNTGEAMVSTDPILRRIALGLKM
jgi:hypothetical protein